MNSPNSMQCSPRQSVDHLRNGKAFPLRHSLILAYVQFDIGMVASHILNLPTKQICLKYKNPDFWKQHFDFNQRPLRRGAGGRQFDGTFWTDGYGVSILMWTPGPWRTKRCRSKEETRSKLKIPRCGAVSPFRYDQ